MKEKKISGIYKITNLINNKFYIGSSKDIYKRWKNHVYELNNKKHHNIILQNAWEKYGFNNFEISIIEVVDKDFLLEVEQSYIKKLNPFGNIGYNIATTTSGGDIISKNPNKKEITEKISASMKKMWNNKTEEEKEIYSKKMIGENNPSWNGGSSFSVCKCGKKIAYINKCCRKCLDFSKEKNPFFGKKHTDEYKKKSSESRKGTYYGSQNIPIIIDGIEYKSLGDASEKLNIKKLTIRYRVNSKNFENYSYK